MSTRFSVIHSSDGMKSIRLLSSFNQLDISFDLERNPFCLQTSQQEGFFVMLNASYIRERRATKEPINYETKELINHDLIERAICPS